MLLTVAAGGRDVTSLVSQIDHKILAAIAPNVSARKLVQQKEIISAFGAMLAGFLDRFEVTTPLRIAHLVAQLAHESDGFCTLEEYASGVAYEGRKDLGNIRVGDGRKFKGRGPIQLTGRDNYRAFTKWIRQLVSNAPDFEAKPELVAEFPWAAWAVFYFWSTRKLNELADSDDLIALTKKINGGTNGLKDRAYYLAKAKKAVARLEADLIGSVQKVTLLRRGMRGAAVEQLQRDLRALGFYHLTIDGIFGTGTEQAVRSFQHANKLTVDGLVGKKTLGMLEALSKVAA